MKEFCLKTGVLVTHFTMIHLSVWLHVGMQMTNPFSLSGTLAFNVLGLEQTNPSSEQIVMDWRWKAHAAKVDPALEDLDH